MSLIEGTVTFGTWRVFEGYVPFHFGRQAFTAGIRVWVPGRIVRHPVYAPALVIWNGGGVAVPRPIARPVPNDRAVPQTAATSPAGSARTVKIWHNMRIQSPHSVDYGIQIK